ncbi:MAG: hypothetical protein ACRDHG_14040 [Anaerolineales bacterium]
MSQALRKMTAKRIATKPSAATPIEPRRYDVGVLVDVLCDHMLGDQRVNDWLQGVVVQADYKMVAVQFNQDVYLTDGWMVPDRVLWARQDSDKIRASARSRVRPPRAARKRRK